MNTNDVPSAPRLHRSEAGSRDVVQFEQVLPFLVDVGGSPRFLLGEAFHSLIDEPERVLILVFSNISNASRWQVASKNFHFVERGRYLRVRHAPESSPQSLERLRASGYDGTSS